MAKWGEGDPRWIVEERPDAINVNNWHWTEKEASPWSRDVFEVLFEGLVIEQASIGKVTVDRLGTIQGEACINNRKAKLIYIYDWDLELKWSGRVNGRDLVVGGMIRIPNLSDENDIDEIDVSVTVNDEDRKLHPEVADALKEMVRKHGAGILRSKCQQYIQMLKTEFSAGVILPKKTEDNQPKT